MRPRKLGFRTSRGKGKPQFRGSRSPRTANFKNRGAHSATPAGFFRGHLGGSKYFFSAKRFLWESLPSLVSLSYALYAHDLSSGFDSGLKVFAKLRGNLSQFDPESAEHQVYTNILTHYKGCKAFPTESEILSALEHAPSAFTRDEILLAINNLKDRKLISESEGHLVPEW